eukprot:3032230-Pleurochrysis_carterae.AAC.1
MAEECPGATDSPARPSESGAEGTEVADLLASASSRALSARRRMTVAGESKPAPRRPPGHSEARVPAPGRKGGPGWRHVMEERRSREAIPCGRRHQRQRRWGGEWCGAW